MNATRMKIDKLMVKLVRRYAVAVFILATLAASACTLTKPKPEPKVQAFVQQVYIDGFPFNEARSYSASAVPVLRRMLADDANQAYWPNVVTLLGLIGGDRAVNALIEFQIQASTDPLTVLHLKAKLGAIVALGYAAYTSENARALAYLRQSVQPGAWRARAISWRSPFHTSPQELHVLLTEIAVIGLGFTADPSASSILRDVIDKGRDGSVATYKSLVGVAEEALATHGLVTKRGLEGYYRRVGCLPFSAEHAVVTSKLNRWKLTLNGLIYADFGNSESNARKALDILRTYEITEQCFVGMPQPQMEYYLANGRVPVGAARGEKCAQFDSSRLSAKRVRESWHVSLVQKHYLEFPSRRDAERAISTIHRYGFGRFCIVGEPTSPSLTYFAASP